MITTNQILSLVRTKILESTTELVTDATLLTYANFTYQDIYKRVFPNASIKSADIVFTAGVGTLPTDFGTLYGDPIDSERNLYPELSIDDFKNQTTSQGVTIEGGVIKIFPEDKTLSIKYYPTFSTLTTSNNPANDTYFQEPLIYGTLMRCYEDLQDESLSQFYEQKYERMINQRIAIESNYEENNQRGGQLFSEQTLI
jgi:hypothetical protein